MRLFRGILATSHADRHNEIMPVETLKVMADQINSQYIPMGVEHDPRIPPLGRLISAQVVQLEDGEYAVEGMGEIFEPQDKYELKNDGRVIPLHKLNTKNIEISFDRNYRDQEDQQIIKEIGMLLGSSPQEEIKKSFDPISILTIGGAFVLGGIANGFLRKIGSEAYDALKTKLSKLLKRKGQKRDKENLLVFSFLIDVEGTQIEIETVLTNPSEDDINEFFNTGISQLDHIVPDYLDGNSGVRRITAEYSNKEVKIKFGVRKDAIPIFPKEQRRLHE